ncbi:T9SS type A sorting domain-containing protein [Flavobacterium hauense]
MKNLYLSVCTILMCCTGVYAQQLHNANWYFGNNAGYDFLADPDPTFPTSISTALSSDEACASYSNGAGQFLFYTNGRQVYNANNTLMTNGSGLLSHTSNSQLAIIKKPRVMSQNIEARIPFEAVYLVTINGDDRSGLYYSEVNTYTGTDGEVINKNTVLNDHLGVPINQTYNNRSEKLTTALHCNGNDYWLITQIGQYIYSYHVSSDGIESTPSGVSIAPFNLLAGITNSAFAGQMKISPNNDRIAVAYRSIGNFNGALALGNFDSSTGLVTFDQNMIAIPAPAGQESNNLAYAAEFSPDSQQVYFGMGARMYRGNAYTATTSNVTLIAPDVSGYIWEIWGMQLGMNGKIYCACVNPSLSFSPAVISNPNSTTSPDYGFSFSPGVGSGTIRAGFPAWVLSQMGACDTSYALYNPDLNVMPHVYRVGDHITTMQDYKVFSGREITMRAGQYVEMNPNTTIEAGSVFLAEIIACQECTGSFSSQIQKENTRSILDSDGLGLKLYPNPTSDQVALHVKDDILKNITVTSLEGKTVYMTSSDTSDYTLDVSALPKGVYIISVNTNKGTYSEKLIVK